MREPETRLTAAHALCAYAEPLARAGRLLVVADATHDFATRFTELGARSVHTYDPDAARAASLAGSTHGRVIRSLPAFDRGEDFEVRDGAYDLAFVPDLGAVPDPAALLARLRRVLGAEGALLVGARNPDRFASQPGQRSRAIAYADLYDLVNLQFASIRMLAQLPFHGVVIAELGLEGAEPEVTVDTQLAQAGISAPGGSSEPDEDREGSGRALAPELYLALASQKDVRLDAYTVIQLPSPANGPANGPASTPVALPASDGPNVAALAEARLRAEVLQSQLDEAKALSARFVDGDLRAQELETALIRLHGEARTAESRASEHHARTEHLADALSRLEQALLDERERSHALSLQLEDAERGQSLRDAEAAAAAEERRRLVDVVARVRVLEAALAETAAAARALETRAVMAEDVLLVRTEELRVVLEELDAVRESAATVAFAPAPATDPSVVASVAAATAALSAMSARAERAEMIVAQLEADLGHAGELHSEELGALEGALRERAQTIQRLEGEVLRRERLVHELVSALDEARAATDARGIGDRDDGTASAAPVAVAQAKEDRGSRDADEMPRLRAQLEALSLEIARREGELEARAWRITELEREVTLLGKTISEVKERSLDASSQTGPTDAAVVTAASTNGHDPLRAELDALRQALAQEHAEKVRAESGDLLEEARAELARQTVLIEQLSRELAARTDAGGAS